MALIKCPECGKDVSSTCETCPHCGYKLKNTNTTKTSYFSEHASKVYERNQVHKWIGEIIAAVLLCGFGIASFVLSGIYSSDQTLRIIFLVLGLIFLLIGIIGIVYYIYRLKTY